MECIFASVMNEALLCIGSNEDRETNLAICQQHLNTIFKDKQIIYSDTSITIPYGENYKKDFINQLVIIKTHKKKEEVTLLLKSLEVEMGRTSTHKEEGMVIIDIDLVMWNDEIIKPEDMKRDYIKDLLNSLSLAR